MLKQRHLFSLRIPHANLQHLHRRVAVASFSSNNTGIGDVISNLRAIEQKAIWLSAYIVHNANTLRPKRVFTTNSYKGLRVCDMLFACCRMT